MSSETIQLIGGPLDGMSVPRTGYFKEGDIEAVDTFDWSVKDPQWSPESVYRTKGGNLVYDEEATKKRRAIVESEKGSK